ncbi:hypothetical protein HK405_011468 [Cladochytrium tenue]|nr:hypothetical protein HK405_011468 [Cladochytrium tenue]
MRLSLMAAAVVGLAMTAGGASATPLPHPVAVPDTVASASTSASAPAASSTSSSSTSDPCRAILQSAANGYVVVRAGDVIDCYQAFGVSADTRSAQTAALKSYYNLYPFLDMANGSATPYFTSKVDVMGGLDAIAANTSLTTEFELQDAISRLIVSLNDGHASYTPACFVNIPLLLPFVFASNHARSGQVPELVVKGAFTQASAMFTVSNATNSTLASVLDAWWSTNGLGGADASSFKDSVVVSIDGQDPIAYVQAFADTYLGVSRVADSRFNLALASYTISSTSPPTVQASDGSFYLRRKPFVGQRDYLELVLLSPTGSQVAVNATWAGLPPYAVSSSLTSASAYYDAFCKAANSSSSTSGNSLAASSAGGSGGMRSSALSSASSGIVRLQADILPGMPNSMHRVAVLPPHTGRGSFRRAIRGFSDHPSNLDLTSLRPPSRQELIARVMPHMDLLTKSTKRNDGTSSAFSISNPVVYDASNAFYSLDGSTGVWVLKTFMPEDTSDTGLMNWLSNITTGLASLEQLGVTRLLIDVSNNGGGIICIGQALVNYLMNDQNVVHIDYDMRSSSQLMALVHHTVEGSFANSTTMQSQVFTLTNLATPSGTAMTTPEDLFSAGREFVRGGVQGLYTNAFIDSECTSFQQLLTSSQQFAQLSGGWGFSNVALVSNGICGSTCAAFGRTLRDQFSVPAFSYAGASGAAFQPTSFEGGSVAHFDALLDGAAQAAAAYGADDIAGAPTAFPLPVDGSIAFWEGYSMLVNTQVPAEWVPDPADYHLTNVADPTDPVAVWTAAAAQLEAIAQSGAGTRGGNYQLPTTTTTSTAAAST